MNPPQKNQNKKIMDLLIGSLGGFSGKTDAHYVFSARRGPNSKLKFLTLLFMVKGMNKEVPFFPLKA